MKLNKFFIVFGLMFMILFGFFIYKYFFSNSGDINEGKIKIGFMAPFNGDSSSTGFSALKGAQLAKKMLGADNIEIVVVDSGCDKNKSPSVVQDLVNKNVVAVIGEICSGASLAALPLANENKVVLISPGSTSPNLSIKNDYFFRVVSPDNLQGEFAAQIMYEKGFRKLAIIHSNEEYGNSFKTVLSNSFKKLGGSIAEIISFETDSIKLEDEITKIKNTNPDVVYIISNSVSSSGAILKLFRKSNEKLPLYGSEALNDQTIFRDAGGASEGVIITAVSTGNKTFKQSFKGEFGIDPGLYSPQAYDAFEVISRAIKSGAQNGEEIKEFISGIDFMGQSGQIKFDSFGEVAPNYELLIVKNGKAIPLDQ